MAFLGVFTLAAFSSLVVYAVPPEACFANFRWEDCGKPPKPVMYYWKSGSRCEVAIWRGCLPNPNMFADEYECINTCIFGRRGSVFDALDELKEKVEPEQSEDESEPTTVSLDNSTETAGNSTNASVSEDKATEVAGGDDNAGDNTQTNPEGEAAGGEEKKEEENAGEEKPAEEAPEE